MRSPETTITRLFLCCFWHRLVKLSLKVSRTIYHTINGALSDHTEWAITQGTLPLRTMALGAAINSFEVSIKGRCTEVSTDLIRDVYALQAASLFQFQRECPYLINVQNIVFIVIGYRCMYVFVEFGHVIVQWSDNSLITMTPAVKLTTNHRNGNLIS